MDLIEILTLPFNHHKFLVISEEYDFTASYYYKGKLLGDVRYFNNVSKIEIEALTIYITNENEILRMKEYSLHIEKIYNNGYSYKMDFSKDPFDFETDSKGNIVKGKSPFDLDISNILELENDEVQFYLKLQDKI